MSVSAKTDVKAVPTRKAVEAVSWFDSGVRAGVVDVGIWSLAVIGALVLHHDGALPSVRSLTAALIVLVPLNLLTAGISGLHRQSWRKFGFTDAWSVVGATAAAAVMGLAVELTVPGQLVSVSVPIVSGMLAMLLMLGARGAVRTLDERRSRQVRRGRRLRKALLIGAGEAGSMLVREMLRHPETGLQPIGFIDDDRSKHGRTIASVPVLGGLDVLGLVVHERHVDEVLICVPSAEGRTVRNIVERVRAVAPDIQCRTMPALHELLSGRVQINRIRDVTIDDLLRRPPVELDTEGILGYLKGKRVMVTGAGGSIGSELVRQICAFEPKELILFGHGENSIYQLERELDVHFAHVAYRSVIAAVQNLTRLESIFRRYRPDVIFHTAAHKHVPLMEQNPEEAVFNNIVGSRNLVGLALRYGVTHFVNVSTDKAVNPTSVMGASKHFVEMVVEAASRRAGPDQSFVSVRFGNVLGSRGSAVPIFQKQIAAGGPVTVTHPDMVRYFMTIPEASRLVLQASAQGKNGEIYILDMGEPVRVLDLVQDLIRLSGFEPEIDVPITFTGVRPGEKLHEELMTEREKAGRTGHDKIFVARAEPVDVALLEQRIQVLVEAALQSDGETIRKLLLAGTARSSDDHFDGAVPMASRIVS